MATVWSWVILVIVLGLVSTFEIVMISSVVGKNIESKIKTIYEMRMKESDHSWDKFETACEKIAAMVTEAIEKEKAKEKVKKAKEQDDLDSILPY